MLSDIINSKVESFYCDNVAGMDSAEETIILLEWRDAILADLREHIELRRWAVVDRLDAMLSECEALIYG